MNSKPAKKKKRGKGAKKSDSDVTQEVKASDDVDSTDDAPSRPKTVYAGRFSAIELPESSDAATEGEEDVSCKT